MSTALPDWQLKSVDGVEYYEYTPHPRLLIAFLTRKGGTSKAEYESLNLSYNVGDDARNVEENYSRARQALRLAGLVTVKQVHKDTVLPITNDKTPAELLEGDACFTDQLNLGLGLKVADCLPVYFYSNDLRCVGIAHCGWRGTLARIAEKTAHQMSRRFSVPLPDLRFSLGPCICPNCYPVGEDVRKAFESAFPSASKFFTEALGDRDGSRGKGESSATDVRRSQFGARTFRLDLRATNRWLLKEMGLVETRSLDLCTKENESLFYSARRSPVTGRNLAVIALRSSPPL
jgi:YfiH family protein